MRPHWIPLVALIAALAAPFQALAVRWEPLDVAFVDEFDPTEVSQRMAADKAFDQSMVERFYFSGEAIRRDFLQRFKSGALRAETSDQKARMKAQLERFQMLPLAKFHYFQITGTSQAELESFCKNHGLHLHFFRKSSWMGLGIIGKSFHTLVSGADAGIAAMGNQFKYAITYQDPVDEFSIKVQYKVGGNWAEFLVPTGERYARDLGMMDAHTAAHVFSKLVDNEVQGVQELISSGFITLHEGKAAPEKISAVKVEAFLPFHQEPFYSN